MGSSTSKKNEGLLPFSQMTYCWSLTQSIDLLGSGSVQSKMTYWIPIDAIDTIFLSGHSNTSQVHLLLLLHFFPSIASYVSSLAERLLCWQWLADVTADVSFSVSLTMIWHVTAAHAVRIDPWWPFSTWFDYSAWKSHRVIISFLNPCAKWAVCSITAEKFTGHM